MSKVEQKVEEQKVEEQKKQQEKKEVDLTQHRVDSVVSVVPLEPCVVWVAISDIKDEESGFKSIGIPGFYDHKSKRFITLDGGRVTIQDFNEKLGEYVKEIEIKNIPPQEPPNSLNNLGG